MTTFQAPAVLARAARRWLLLSAALVPQLAAAQATTAVGDAASPPSATVAPGAAARALDAFTLQTTAGTDVVTSATVTLAAGSWVALAAVSIQNTSACNQATPLGTNAPGSSVVTIALAGVTATPTLTTYHVCVTPKAHAAMPTPPGAEHAVTGTVTAISSTNPATYADATSATITVDNRSPGNATWGAITPASNQVTLAWTAPADADFTQVVVLRNANAPVVDGPAEGAILAPGDLLPNSRVVCVQAAGPCVDGGLTNGTPYYYRAFAKDGNGNYAIGVSAGPAYPGTNNLPVGSADGARPMVSILNPGDGAVVSGSTLQPFRVQARVWSPSLAIQAVELTTNGGASWAPLSKSANYGGTATSGVWEGQPTLAAGSYSLVVRARNDAAAWINSAPVGVIVKAPGTGDGRMLVRDNSSQLCSDCHAHKAHGSETVGTAYGSWSTVCRDCHTPHGTTNIFLVPTQITPPPRGAAVTPARDVVFHDRNVLENASRTGPCQVCHAQTKYYRADGTSPGGTHYTGDCARCHKHADGLKAKCTTCHGDATETRPLGPGADTLAYAAPPVVAPEAVVFVPDGGVHLSHANRATWRATVLACAECHATPNDHQGTTDVQWGTLATGGGTVTVAPATGAITSQWITTPSCTNYCHGASLAGGGGAVAAPAWDAPGPGGACGDCHASPPPLSSLANQDHPQNAACASCHGTGYAQLSLDPVAKVTHLDGTLGKPGNGCTACHGDLAGLSGAAQPNTNLAAAPGYTPGTGVDTEGHTAVTFPGVGAHEAHVKTGVMAAKSCEVCHGSKPADGNTSHANGTIALGFTSPANANGAPTTPTAFDATWEVTPTCTNYCHSNATPLGGALAQQTVTWTSATGMGCTSCHDAGGAASALSVAHRKHTSATTYAYGCERCHTSTTSDGTAITGPASHVDGGRTLAFNASPLDQAGAFYRGTATTPNYTCTNTYCHSSGVDRAPPFATGNSIAWTATSSCGSCHAGGSAMATRSHAAHVNNGTYLGTNVGCAGCHDTAASDSAIAAGKHGQHVNGLVETTGTSYADGTADGVANGSCGTSSCHSNGTENLVLADYRSVQWGVTALADDCKGCHGTEVGSIAGAPWYASSTASVKTRNSHPKHVGSASDCVTCHAGTVTALGALIPSGTLHLDGQGEVSGAGIGSYDPGTESCSTVTCHGTGTPVWGDPATATCASCHLTTAADRDSWVIDDGTPALVNGGEWTGYGHGSTSTTGNSFAEFAAVASSDRCAYCHDTQNASANHKQAGNPFRLRGAAGVGGATQPYDPTTSDVTRIAVCMNCHDNTNANGVDPDGAGGLPLVGPATARIDSYHHATKHGTGNDGGLRCWDCHDAHGDGANIKMIGSDVLADATDVHGLGGTRAATAVVFTANATGTDYARSAATFNGICNVCHAATGGANHYDRDSGDGHNSGQKCTSCHLHDQLPRNYAFFGGESRGNQRCSACHAPTSGYAMKVADAARAASYHHVMEDDLRTTGAAPNETAVYPTAATPTALTTDYDKTCVQCHADHNLFRPDVNTGGVTRGYNLRTAIGTAPPAFVTPAAPGTVSYPPGTNAFTNQDASLPPASPTTGVCVSCHATAQTKNTTDQKSDGTAATPAIDATSFAASAHDYAVGGTITSGTGSTFNTVCTKCHSTAPTQYQTGKSFALHESPDRRLRAPLGQATLQDDRSEAFCYRCHSKATDAIGGTVKPAADADWYGAVTNMSAASQDVYAQMQKGTPGTAPGAPTTTTNTLYFKPSAQEAAPVTLTGHYGNDTFVSGTFGTRSMSPYAPTAANELWDNTAVTTSTTNPARYRRVSFVSPPVATQVTLSAAAWTVAPFVQTSSTTPNPHTRYAIWKYDGTCTYVGATPTCQSIVARATYGTGTTNRWTTTMAQQSIATANGSAVTLNVGDRIVVDLEVETQSTTAATSCLMNYGFGATAQAYVTIPNAVTFTYTDTVGTPAVGRHDVGTYSGVHRPNPGEETRAYIAANRHVECEDCHNPHAAQPGLHVATAPYTVTASQTLYLRDTNAINTVPPVRPGAYQYSSGTYSTNTFTQRDMAPASGATAATTAISTGNLAARYGRGLQFVSPQLDSTVTIPSGSTFTLTLRESRATGTSTDFTRFTVYKWSGGTATPFNTSAAPGNFAQNATAIGTTATNRVTTFTTNQAVTLNPGDAIVADVEFYHQTGTTALNVTYAYGAFATDGGQLALPAATYSWRTGGGAKTSRFAPVLTGATGVQVTTWGATNWSGVTTWNPSTTTAPLVTATAEWQICFKCHSSANGSLATWNGTWTDLALEFNQANQSYHPVIGPLPATDPGVNGSSRLGPTQLIGTDRTWTPGETMTCTDCHNADAASPAAQGPHGSAIRYMLAGTNKAWPFTVAGATSGTPFRVATADTGLGTVNGLFCRNCHPSPQTGTDTNNFHSNADVRGGQHGADAIMNCVRCHIRVPHGGKVSRLMVTTLAPARYQVSGQAPNLDNFMKGANKDGYGTISNFFDSTCGTHNALLATPEAW